MTPRKKRRSVAGERALAQLTAKLFFAPEDGRIWLDDQRMVLLHAGALGALRREVIHALGLLGTTPDRALFVGDMEEKAVVAGEYQANLHAAGRA